jgi:nucleoside-diphosphate-sugar epimerase
MGKKIRNKMRYAITGHRGLIGEYLRKRLDDEGHQCILSIDQREGFNVNDLMFRESEIKGDIDVFFHFAAQCRINEAIANPFLPHKNNVDGILAVLEFCRKHKISKVVVASTSRVLSNERNPYVASKVYVEEMVKAYHDCYGIDYIIVRPSTVYGPMFDETSRLINNFLTNALRGNDLRIYGNEDKTLDFTYIDDFIDGVMLVFNKNRWNEGFNISGHNEVKLVDVAKEVIAQTGSHSRIVFLPKEIAQPQQVNVDTYNLNALGYVPKVNIVEGIRRMVDFYRNNPEALERYEDKGKKYFDFNSRENLK